MSKKGRLIVFEGIDGSGKATQSKLLFNYLRKNKIPSEHISFPDYESSWGKLVKRYLQGEFGDIDQVNVHLAAVLYAGDRLLASEKIRRWLEAGKIVVCDRYAQTNVAHQAAKIKNKKDRESFMNWLSKFEYEGNNIPKEDAVIFLAVPVSVSQKLMRSRRKDIHEQDVDYLAKVANIFEELAKGSKLWKRVECVKEGKIIDKETIHRQVLKLLNL